jgi:hypothetical protein
MNPRDVALVAAVLLLGGFAVADAVRKDASTTPLSTTAERSDTVPRRETFVGLPVAGDLAVTTGDDCRLRDFSVSTGIEYPLPRIETTCDLWAPPLGNRLAYAIGQTTLAVTGPIRFIDVGRPLLDLGTFEAFSGVHWSRDGQRAAWCESATSGRVYEVGAFDIESGRRAVRRVDFCPRAFTPDGRLASTLDRELLVEGRTLLVADGHIDHVQWGQDGSLGLLLDGARIERRVGRRVTHSVDLPGPFRFVPRALLSPDNCAALLQQRARIHILDVGCFRGRDSITNISPDNCLNRRQVNISRCASFPSPRSFPGLSAVWSPDGEWIAVAELDAVAFHRVVGRYEAIRWETSANRLAWR